MKNKKTENKQDAKAVSIAWTQNAWEECLSWQNEDPKIVNGINHLLDECLRDPFRGTGQPEPLKGNLTGFCSRRITKVHRLVYLPEDGAICVVACRFHY